MAQNSPAWALQMRAGWTLGAPIARWLRWPFNEFEVMPEHADQMFLQAHIISGCTQDRKITFAPSQPSGGNSGPAQSWTCSGETDHDRARGSPAVWHCNAPSGCPSTQPSGGGTPITLSARQVVVGDQRASSPGRWTAAPDLAASSTAVSAQAHHREAQLVGRQSAPPQIAWVASAKMNTPIAG